MNRAYCGCKRIGKYPLERQQQQHEINSVKFFVRLCETLAINHQPPSQAPNRFDTLPGLV